MGQTLDTVFAILFWASLSGLALTYVVYPLSLLLVSRILRDHDDDREAARVEQLPSVTVLIAAHNAADHIVSRIDNILACDYPRHRLRIVVASDGSSDDTVDRVKRMGLANVRAIDFEQRRGKAGTLVQAIRQVDSEVVLFTDATTVFEVDAIRNLARHFVDPEIGLATGKAVIVDAEGRSAESVYWRTELMIRRVEARLGIMLGASGAIYAIRRRWFVDPGRSVINDDLVFPMLMQLKHRCGIVFDESARAFAVGGGGWLAEFRRRRRIGAGAIQCLPALSRLLQRRHAKVTGAFVTHKLLRWFGPFMLIAALISNLALVGSPVYRGLLALQATGYLLAVAGFLLPKPGRLSGLAHTASSFLLMNLALLAGLIRWARQPSNVIWSPTLRSATSLQLIAAQHRRIEQDELAA